MHQPVWSLRAEQTVRGLLANRLPETHPGVLEQAERHGALPVGWDLWSHFFLTPDGTLLRIDIELGEGTIESCTDRIHVLWGLVMGCERYPELRELLPERPAEARDCECIHRPAQFSRLFCPHCGGVQWLPPGP